MENLFRLDGRVALVIGGAGGIGCRLAAGLSHFGAKVIIASRGSATLHDTAKQIQSETAREVVALPVDVTNEQSVNDLVEAVIRQAGTIDILVNAMGLNLKRDAFEYPMDDWDRLFAVNVKGTMIACKAVGKIFKTKRSGKIINLSSVRGIRGYDGGNVGYCATKGSVELITRALALEWAPFNIHVNALGPALIITPGTVHIQNNPELAQKQRSGIPLARLGQPDDVVGACVFLASAASDFITGQTIYVDGGLTAR